MNHNFDRSRLRRSAGWVRLVAVLVSTIVAPGSAQAAWPADPAVNVAIADSFPPNHNIWPEMVADGRGGAFVGWNDVRTGHGDFRLQRLSRNGTVAIGWPSEGIVAGPNYVDSWLPGRTLLPSGSDGCIVVWHSMLQNQSLVQKFDTAGTARWTPGGVVVPASRPTPPFGPNLLAAAPMPDGGVMVFWRYWDLFSGDTLFAMRITSEGQRAWPRNLVVNDSPGQQRNARATAVSDSEVVVVWGDGRTDPNYGQEIYGQRIGASGLVKWPRNGVRFLSEGFDFLVQSNLRGGWVGCFVHYTGADSHGDLKLVNIGPDGNPLPGWPADGLVLAAVPGAAELASALSVSPSDGSVMVSWWNAEASAPDVLIQKVDTTGAFVWSAPRVVFHPPASAPNYNSRGDGEGGMFVGLAVYDGADVDIRAQHVRSDGSFQWAAAGVPVSTAPGHQIIGGAAFDSSGGVYFCWRDNRVHLDNRYDLYAQHVNGDGSLGGDVTATVASAVSAAVVDGCARIRWHASDAAGVVFAVERRGPQGVWERLAQATADGTGGIEHVDCDVEAGRAYGYRLGWAEEGAPRWTVPIELVIAPAPGLALRPPMPNPVEASAIIEYSLPSREQVRLIVVDLAGRRVATVDEGTREAGVHRVDWQARTPVGAPLPPGSYALRLESTRGSQVRRFVIVR